MAILRMRFANLPTLSFRSTKYFWRDRFCQTSFYVRSILDMLILYCTILLKAYHAFDSNQHICYHTCDFEHIKLFWEVLLKWMDDGMQCFGIFTNSDDSESMDAQFSMLFHVFKLPCTLCLLYIWQDVNFSSRMSTANNRILLNVLIFIKWQIQATIQAIDQK